MKKRILILCILSGMLLLQSCFFRAGDGHRGEGWHDHDRGDRHDGDRH